MRTTVTCIQPKGGELTELHSDILGCECSILQLFIAGRDRILIEVPVTNSGRERQIITSGIEKYQEEDAAVIVETDNSVYTFRSDV